MGCKRMNKNALLLFALLVVMVAGCEFYPVKGDIPEDHLKIFWGELDMAVYSFVLCWLVLGFSRYVSNRLRIGWGKHSETPKEEKPEPQPTPAPEKPKLEGPLFQAIEPESKVEESSGDMLEMKEIDEDEVETKITEPSKPKEKKAEKIVIKRSIPTALIIALFVAILFFGLFLAADYMMSYRIKHLEEAKVIPFDRSSPTKIMFHLWGPSFAFKHHFYHAFFINTVVLFNMNIYLHEVFANTPRIQDILYWKYFNYLLGFLCFYIPAYIGARRTKTLWFFPLLLLVLNVALTFIALEAGWYADAVEVFNNLRESLKGLEIMDLPIDLP